VSASGSPAPRGATASDRGPVQHVVFLVDATRYALPLAAVREVVVQPDSLVRVPRGPAPVLGVVNLRGRVVTVVDFPLLLDLPRPAQPHRKLILLDRGRRDLALSVTDVEGIEMVEKVSSQPRESRAPVRGVTRVKGVAVTVLDPDALDVAVTHLFDRG
jgi:purine-binding chemotaxis protein CheW